ncbi:hypothetical protein LENED_004843 [Lentinula edodes]|uniref:Uncharacterized protein n=1 Tax=Lentinula edodes TaxID=5353 RepID=A0A1Q3E7D1_LENED|nr:hypothetical protein LENED_004843 [Lentinula edodes]
MNQMTHPQIVGSHPPPFPQIAGDFSAHGGYYMFASREEALYWGNSFAALSSGRKFMIVELTYHAQALVHPNTICSYPSGDINWQRFVHSNQAHPPPNPPSCPLVEGPLSQIIRDQYVPATSAITGQPMWQYAIRVFISPAVAVKKCTVFNLLRGYAWICSIHRLVGDRTRNVGGSHAMGNGQIVEVDIRFVSEGKGTYGNQKDCRNFRTRSRGVLESFTAKRGKLKHSKLIHDSKHGNLLLPKSGLVPFPVLNEEILKGVALNLRWTV